jgi:hypothetical protein
VVRSSGWTEFFYEPIISQLAVDSTNVFMRHPSCLVHKSTALLVDTHDLAEAFRMGRDELL